MSYRKIKCTIFVYHFRRRLSESNRNNQLTEQQRLGLRKGNEALKTETEHERTEKENLKSIIETLKLNINREAQGRIEPSKI